MNEFDFERFESKKTGKTLPLGWVVLSIALIIVGVYYFIAYTPGISDWSQEKIYQESIR
ncbi:MAG: hypothetical protein LBV09_02850 [Deferribacteraceae bacterium]|nr:hypothetical protein [Deferribacteraceae bacterium]